MTDIKPFHWLPFLLNLHDKGIACIYIYYSGGGDNGAIDEIKYLPETMLVRGDKPKSEIISTLDMWTDESKKIIDSVPQPTTDENSFIDNQAYAVCLNNIEDWYNNDGGQGTIYIDTKTGKWWNENQVNRMVSDNYNHEGQLLNQE